MKLDKLLFIVGLVCVTLGLASLVIASILSRNAFSTTSDMFLGISSILGVISLAVLIVRLVIMSRMVKNGDSGKPRVVIKVVDVKDLPKSKEQKLYEQYEDLYKQGLITKEDLELKRKELLEK